MIISHYSEADAPTVHRRLVLTIESAASRRRFALINPEPLADLSGLMEAWAFRILDRNREGESSVEFGRYQLEYLDDWPNKAPAEDGGIPSLLFIGCAWPAGPHHER